MKKQDFNCSFTANISAREAIKKISDISNWWGVTFSGNAEKQGDKFLIKMGDNAFFNCIVSELIPDKKVVWSVEDCHMPWYSNKKEWSNTKMIFDISEVKGTSTIHFTHEGLTPEVECYKDCEPGWSHWIRTSLLSYFTTGKGQLKQQKMVKYSTSTDLTKSAIVVFDHLIDLKKWWPEDFDGENIKLNSEFVLTVGGTHYSENKVIELIPGKKFVWLVTDSLRKTDNYTWTGTKMIFELTPKGNITELKFTYDGPVLENEYERLVQICDMCVKEMFTNFIINGKTKENSVKS